MAVQAQYPSNLLFHDRGEPEMDMPRPPQQLAGISPAAAYFSTAGAAEGGHGATAAGGRGQGGVRQSVHAPAAVLRQRGPPAEPEQSLVAVAVPRRDGSKQANASRYSSLFASRLRRARRAGEAARRRDRPVHPGTGRAAEACDSRSASSPQPGDAGQGPTSRQRAGCARRRRRRSARRGGAPSWRTAWRGSAAWQAKALSEQAAAVALHTQLQQAAAALASAKELAAAAAGPAESSSSACVDPRRGGALADRACVGCRLRPASVVLLPCRHLSLCGVCFAAGAMVCLCVRTGSVEAILC